MKATFDLETLKTIVMFVEEYKKLCEKHNLRISDSHSGNTMFIQGSSAFGFMNLCEVEILDEGIAVIMFDLTT